ALVYCPNLRGTRSRGLGRHISQWVAERGNALRRRWADGTASSLAYTAHYSDTVRPRPLDTYIAAACLVEGRRAIRIDPDSAVTADVYRAGCGEGCRIGRV